MSLCIHFTDEGMIEFDGKTSLDIPRHQVPYDSSKKFTVATWIWTKQQKRRQFILAATDSKRLDRIHFGLYTEGKEIKLGTRAVDLVDCWWT